MLSVEWQGDMADSAIRSKSFAFDVRITGLCKELYRCREFVISNQLLRSGESIGANVEEAQAAQSKRDFLAKMSIASKAARETRYWLRLLQESNLTDLDFRGELERVEELIRILTAIVKTSGR